MAIASLRQTLQSVWNQLDVISALVGSQMLLIPERLMVCILDMIPTSRLPKYSFHLKQLPL